MKIPFQKYQATANDFIIVDQMKHSYLEQPESKIISRLCDRRLGVGADGLMLITPAKDADFRMIYYNSDGRESTMCGNGGRAIAHMAYLLGYTGEQTTFEAIDGIHEARIVGSEVDLHMIDVNGVSIYEQDYVVDTGSPHYVTWREGLRHLDISHLGASIRYSAAFEKEGINVNFCEQRNESVHVRTYERGVEGETHSCGTGVTAAALALSHQQQWKDGSHIVPIVTKGGKLKVSYDKVQDSYTNIWLSGPATKVFEGVIEV
ncbi:MAG: diaminopimelate epimerase [Bacteroidota bacterium]